jgi:phosphoglycolate phosphatase
MIDGVIFDLDGTLWDTTEEIYKCWSKYLSQVSIWDIKSCMGLSIDQMSDKLHIPTKDLKRIQKLEVNWLKEHTVTPYMGVTATLQYLRTLGIPCFIVSNCQKGYIECFIQSMGFCYFESWISFGHSHKPKSDNIQNIIDTYKLQNPVYVGDTETDYQAAKQANVPFIWASYGFGKDLQNVVTINSIMELMRIINNV